MKLKITQTIILLSTLIIGTAQADFLDATEAYEKKQYDDAFKEFSELARLGNKRAQFNLGVMYLNGEGVEKDLSLAYAWGKLSEHEARPEFSQISKSILASVDLEERTNLNNRANELQSAFGEVAIHNKLSPIEYIPNKSKENTQRADISMVKKSAPRYPKEALDERKQGWATAIMDVHPDGSVRAVEIIESFPDNSFDQSTVSALSKFKFKVTFPKDIKPYVVQAKQTIIYELKLQANEGKIKDLYARRLKELKNYASQGHPDAQYVYAVAARSYIAPEPQKIKQAEANDWLLKAAQNGHVDAQYLLGKNILRGKGCQIEKQKAIDWIVYAAEQGHDKSAREVHHLLTEFKNLNHTNKSPDAWLKVSAEAGNPESQLEYAQFIAKQKTQTNKQIALAERFLNDYSDNRKKNVYWYQTAAQIELAKGNDKKAKKHQKKAEKLAKKLGWDLTLAAL